MTAGYGQVATRHGTYFHLIVPGARFTICGLSRPVFPAATIGQREQCPRCTAELARISAAANTRGARNG